MSKLSKIKILIEKFKFELGVFVLFTASRLPKLGLDVFNTDVWKWKQRSYDFGSGFFYLDFVKTIQKYHPGVSLMWIGTIAVKILNTTYKIFTGGNPPDNNIDVVFQLHVIQKVLVVIVLGIILAFIFNGLRRLFDTQFAVIAVILVSLEPFYIALTRVFHLEGLMSTFMIASFVWTLVYLKERKLKHLILTGVFSGFALLTKTSSLFLVPFIGLLLFLDFLFNDHKFKHAITESLKIYGKWLGITLITFFVAWPAMWIAPWTALQAMASGVFTTGVVTGHLQLYMNEWVLDPGFGFYFVVLWLRTSLYLAAGVLGLFFVHKKLSPEKQRFALYALLFAIFYFIEMSIPAKKLDRYLLPSIMALSLVAALTFDYLIGWFFGKFKKNSYIWGILLFIPLVLCLVRIHPDYLSYYSPLAGGLKKGMFMIEPKWTFGQQELMDYLSDLMVEEGLEGFGEDSLQTLYYKKSLEKKLVVSFPEKYYTQLYPFLRKIDGWATIEAFTPDAKQSNYFIFPVWDDYSQSIGRFNLVYRDTINVRGVPVYNVYVRF